MNEGIQNAVEQPVQQEPAVNEETKRPEAAKQEEAQSN